MNLEINDRSVFIINKVVYTGVFNILEFIEYSESDELIKYYNDYKNSKKLMQYNIVMTNITDIFLRRRIVEYLYYSMNLKIMPSSFHNYKVKPLQRLMLWYPDLFKMEYKVFLDNIDSVLKISKSSSIDYKNLVHTLYRFCTDKDNENDPFNNDVWYYENFNLTKDRTFGCRLRRIFFEDIKNEKNKFFVKKYVEYLLCNTDNSINTINGRIISLRSMFKQVNIPYDEWTNEIAESFVEFLKRSYANKRTVAAKMITYQHFSNYLLSHDYISDNPLKKFIEIGRIGSFKHSSNSVDESTVNEIFRNLGKIEDIRLTICFLLIYCVGMRVSEACSVLTNCIQKTDKGTFLIYYSIKMKKEVTNIIPPALYDMILEYRKTRINEKYLFGSSIENTPMNTSYFTEKLNKEFERFGIKNPDGTTYHFKPHSFRHRMAAKMRYLDIPFQFIQNQLHHQSPEMTLVYLEYVDRDKINKMNEFVNSQGMNNVRIPDYGYEENVKYVEYMRSSINAQMLPNGVCVRPVKLGKCPYGNACLSCPEYRTSKAYLQIHKAHLKRVEEYIAISEKNGWLPQVESNKETRERLIQIISLLEEKGDDQ